MLNCRTVVLFLSAVVAVSPALAQTVDSELQRDVNQQTRIEQGLQSGQLNTKEASQLERDNAAEKYPAVAKRLSDAALQWRRSLS